MLEEKYQLLYTFVKNLDLSVYQVLQTSDLEDLFHLPLSTLAFEEFKELTNLIQFLDPQNDNGSWMFNPPSRVGKVFSEKI
uniref:Uncharacterized protein n=1 Tax=Leersia perrieri TaxID=77586 RepID=A0A0D9W2E1_9ORYZ